MDFVVQYGQFAGFLVLLYSIFRLVRRDSDAIRLNVMSALTSIERIKMGDETARALYDRVEALSQKVQEVHEHSIMTQTEIVKFSDRFASHMARTYQAQKKAKEDEQEQADKELLEAVIRSGQQQQPQQPHAQKIIRRRR